MTYRYLAYLWLSVSISVLQYYVPLVTRETENFPRIPRTLSAILTGFVRGSEEEKTIETS